MAKQVCGILPLVVLDGAYRLVARPIRKARQRPLPIDLLVKDGEGVLVSIQSARAYAWDKTTTLRFESRLYVIEEHLRSGDQERPYLYRVGQAPMGHLVRAVIDFSPEP